MGLQELYRRDEQLRQQHQQLSEEELQSRNALLEQQAVQSRATATGRTSAQRSWMQEFFHKNETTPLEDTAEPVQMKEVDTGRTMIDAMSVATIDAFLQEDEVLTDLTVAEILLDIKRSVQLGYRGDEEEACRPAVLLSRIEAAKEETAHNAALSNALSYYQEYYSALVRGGLGATDEASTFNNEPIFQLDATQMNLGYSGSAEKAKDHITTVEGKYRDAPLFDHLPSIEDVKQGQVGDCYFMAAMAKEIQLDPTLMLQNIRDNGDNTVTVRFYCSRFGIDIDRTPEHDQVVARKDEVKEAFKAASTLEEKMLLLLESFKEISVKLDSSDAQNIYTATKSMMSYMKTYWWTEEVEIDGKKADSIRHIIDGAFPSPADAYALLDGVSMEEAISNLFKSPHINQFRNVLTKLAGSPELLTGKRAITTVLQAVDVTVTKDLPEYQDGSPVYARGPLGLRLVEKAYAASGLKREKDEDLKAEDKTTRGYRAIEGGQIDEAFFDLTGRNAEKATVLNTQNKILTNSIRSWLSLDQKADLASALKNKYELDLGLAQELVKLLEAAEKKYLKNAPDPEDKAHKVKTYRKDTAGIDDIIRVILDSKLSFGKGKSDRENEEERRSLALRLAGDMAASKRHDLQFARFSGEYTAKAVATYDAIERAIAAGSLVGVGTLQFLPKNAAGSSGETVDAGIVQSHAFTVLGVRTKGNDRFVVLRNPWGSGETVYRRQADGSVAADVNHSRKNGQGGVFLMELNDFLRKTSGLYGVKL